MPTEVDYDLIVDAAYQAGFRDDDLVTAVAVSLAESGGNPSINNAGMNSNGTVDYGLWQINSVHGPDLSSIYDPYTNAEWAFKVFTGRNRTWAPWSAYNNGSYARHMTTARNVVAGYQPGTVDTDGMAQGELAPDPVQEQARQQTPRLRAEQMLADVAKAATRRKARLNGENLLSKTPEEIRGQVEELEVAPDGVDTGEDMDGLSGRLTGEDALVAVNRILARNQQTPESAPAVVDGQPNEEGLEQAVAATGVSNEQGQRIVELARQYLGVDYVWGGVSPTGMDCSGLVLLVAREMGIEMPRVSRDQARAGFEVAAEDARAGDLIAFDAGGQAGVVNHIGIIVGRDEQGRLMMIHAPRTGRQVEVVPVTRNDVMAIRRITGQEA